MRQGMTGEVQCCHAAMRKSLILLAKQYKTLPMQCSADCLHDSLGPNSDKSHTQNATVAWGVLSRDPIAVPAIQGLSILHFFWASEALASSLVRMTRD